MNIRPAVPSDLDDIAAIHIESWQDAYADDLPKEFITQNIKQILTQHWHSIEIQDNDILLVAEQYEILGFAVVWCRPEPYVDNLHVRPSQRSNNIGSALMQAAAEILLRLGHKSAYLYVFESNLKAIRFYARLGGELREKFYNDIFGHSVLSRRIVWDDISKIQQNG
jgi:ribosomal protein S18 acetylase RimI-like enzyme